MKKFTTVAMAALAMASLACAGKATAQVKSSFVIGSTASTSGHYVAAVAMSKALKDEIPNLSVTVLETGASVDNLRRMTRAEIDMGLVGSDAAVSASDGTGQFEGKGIGDLVALFAYDYAALSIAVRADSGVLTLADLNGKRFNPGFRGSGTEVRMKTAFDLFNIKPEWVLGSIKDAVESIQNRQIVGYAKNGVGSLLDPTVRELLISTQMRLLGFSPEQEASTETGIPCTSIWVPSRVTCRPAPESNISVTHAPLKRNDHPTGCRSSVIHGYATKGRTSNRMMRR